MHTYTIYVYPSGWTAAATPYPNVPAVEFIYTDNAVLFLGQDKSPVFSVSLSLNPVIVRVS